MGTSCEVVAYTAAMAADKAAWLANVHGNGKQTPTLPADVAALLQQALAYIHQGAHPPPVKDNVNAMAKTTKPKEGNDASELVPIHKMS